jgi:hypothetical protein
MHELYSFQQHVSCLLILDVAIGLQEKLLSPQYRDLKPDVEFLESFAGVVQFQWSYLAASLSLSHDEIEEVRKKKNLSQQDQAFKMLNVWCLRADATFDGLCRVLQTISLFSVGSSGEL